MNSYGIHNQEDNKDKVKSGIITAIISSLLLLFVFLYKFSVIIPEKSEVVTKMLINFGDNRNGDGVEEPANQEGSLAASETLTPQEQFSEPAKSSNEKLITGNSRKVSTPKSIQNKTNAKAETSKNTKQSAATSKSISTKKSGDGKGKSAAELFQKGKGKKKGSQGINGKDGNNGDPLGGDGNGSEINGIDRKFIEFIPGTLGRKGAQPAHNCTATGVIYIYVTVDRAGNVISADRRSENGGVSDPCIVKTSVGWVKKYVKANTANTKSTGSYKINFQ